VGLTWYRPQAGDPETDDLILCEVVTSGTSGTSGISGTSGACVDVPRSCFKALPWLHGDVTREEAEEILGQDRTVFLIRDSNTYRGRWIP
jgi:hypothetical protein